MEEKLVKALNEQASQELDNANTYLQIASIMDDLGFEGAAHFFNVHYQEELYHGIKLVNFIRSCGLKHELRAIQEPSKEVMAVSNLIEAFEVSLESEYYNTDRINDVMALAIEYKDYKVINFMNWYVEEQVEEEELFSSWLAKSKISNGINDLIVDEELKTRVLDPTSQITTIL